MFAFALSPPVPVVVSIFKSLAGAAIYGNGTSVETATLALSASATTRAHTPTSDFLYGQDLMSLPPIAPFHSGHIIDDIYAGLAGCGTLTREFIATMEALEVPLFLVIAGATFGVRFLRSLELRRLR